MESAARQRIETSINRTGSDGAIVVAGSERSETVDFAPVTRQEKFTGEPQSYLGERVAARRAELYRAGRALVRAIEGGSQAQGL